MPESLKQKTIKGLTWNAVNNFITRGISFLLGILLARLLSPGDYGLIAMISVFIAILSVFIDSGMTNALIRKQDRSEADLATVFYFNLAVSCLIYVVMFVSAPFIADFYRMPQLVLLTRILTIGIVIGAFGGIQGAVMSINLDFKTPAKISIVSTLLSGIIGILFAFMGYGVWALVIQSLVATTIGTLGKIYFVRWRPSESFSKQSFKELFGFSSKLLASWLIGSIYENMYTMVIGKFFSAVQLGLYARAQSMAQFPSSNATGVLQSVTYPVLAKMQDDNDRLAHNYRRMLRLSAYIIFPMMIGLSSVSASFIHFVLTDKWVEAVPYLQIICFAFMWYPIHAINLNLLQVKGRSDLFLRLEIIKRIMGVIMLCVTIPLGLMAMCYGCVLMSVISLVINAYYTGKLIHVGFIKQMGDLMPIFIDCILMGGICYLVQLPFINSGIRLFIAVVTGVVYYIGSSYVRHSSEMQEVLSLIKRK